MQGDSEPGLPLRDSAEPRSPWRRGGGRAAIATYGAVLAAVFLGALDQTVIVTVLPAVITDLDIPFNRLDQAAWIVSGYLVGYTVALPLVGRLADVRGRRFSFIGALVLFAAGSVGCAVAPSLLFLVGFRVLQAAGGGALLPVAIAIVSDRYPRHRRVFAIGLVGAVAEAGGVVGPLYGAALVTWLGWRWIFWLNLPLALLLLLVALRGLPTNSRRPGSLDVPGAVVSALALTTAIVGLGHEPIMLAGLDLRPWCLGIGVTAAVTFCLWETRTSEPLLDLRLFRRPAFAAAIFGGLVLGVALIVAMVDVPLYAATVLSASPADGGLLLLRLTALIPVGAMVGGLLGQRAGFGAPTGLGFIFAAIGLAAISRWGASPDSLYLWLSLGLAGIGFGLLIAPLSTAAVNEAGVGSEASGAALFSVSRLVGMAFGLAALTLWGLQRLEDLAGPVPLPIPIPDESAASATQKLADYNAALLAIGVEIYRELFLAAALLCALGIATAFLLDTVRPVGHDGERKGTF